MKELTSPERQYNFMYSLNGLREKINIDLQNFTSIFTPKELGAPVSIKMAVLSSILQTIVLDARRDLKLTALFLTLDFRDKDLIKKYFPDYQLEGFASYESKLHVMIRKERKYKKITKRVKEIESLLPPKQFKYLKLFVDFKYKEKKRSELARELRVDLTTVRSTIRVIEKKLVKHYPYLKGIDLWGNYK